jgi:hypothetical protein
MYICIVLSISAETGLDDYSLSLTENLSSSLIDSLRLQISGYNALSEAYSALAHGCIGMFYSSLGPKAISVVEFVRSALLKGAKELAKVDYANT